MRFTCSRAIKSEHFAQENHEFPNLGCIGRADTTAGGSNLLASQRGSVFGGTVDGLVKIKEHVRTIADQNPTLVVNTLVLQVLKLLEI